MKHVLAKFLAFFAFSEKQSLLCTTFWPPPASPFHLIFSQKCSLKEVSLYLSPCRESWLAVGRHAGAREGGAARGSSSRAGQGVRRGLLQGARDLCRPCTRWSWGGRRPWPPPCCAPPRCWQTWCKGKALGYCGHFIVLCQFISSDPSDGHMTHDSWHMTKPYLSQSPTTAVQIPPPRASTKALGKRQSWKTRRKSATGKDPTCTYSTIYLQAIFLIP